MIRRALLLAAAVALTAQSATASGTRLSGDWERGLQMISETDEELAQEANIDSEYLFDRFKLKLTHPFAAGVEGSVEYVQENKDFRAYDTYDNIGRHVNTALTLPVADGWKLKLSNRTWWKAYGFLPNKDSLAVVSGALLTFHPSTSPWDFSFNYYYKDLDYDDDVRQEFENQQVHTLIISAERQLTENLRVNVRGRQKNYDFESKTNLILRIGSIGFDYEF
ncbi:MAG TPA: hypothetical protein PKM88_10945 [bacterium]|nr:hypothetical protein [bacterium]